ncbi:MAG: ABC transporter permease [Actinomycetota bacterium]|nr:ABC transporter permease [Actinomycetota bacterium]
MWSLPLLLLSSLLVFVMVAKAIDPLADLRVDADVSSEVLAARSRALGLDRPVLARYGSWVGNALHGDLGTTLGGRSVRDLLWERLLVTMRMVTAGLAIAVLGSMVIGCLSALRPRSKLDNLLTVVGMLLLSLPVFWLGGVLKELAIRVNDLAGRRIVSTIGQADPNLSGGLLDRWGNYAGHLLLPTIALATVLVAAWSRYVRSSMIEVLPKEYMDVARAKGLSPARVTVGHGLRNALVPFTSVAAVDFGQVLGGAVVLEQVYGWQGMGRLLLDGVLSGDTNVVLGWVLVTVVLVLVFNLLADVAVAYLDARTRLG